MTRLTKADEKRATEALAKCAAETKNIDDPKELNDKAFDILYKELGDKPELLKRACEGYNSAKSVYRLGAATDDTRGNDFALLDAPALAKRASEKTRNSFISKSASEYGVKKAQFVTTAVRPATPIQKTASAKNREVEAPPMRKLSSAEVRGEAVDYIEDIHYSLRKVASAYKRAEEAVPESEEEFIHAMDKLTPSLRKQAAELLSGAYGEIGSMLVDLYNAAKPMNKIASYSKSRYKGDVRLPDEPLYKSAWNVLEAHVLKKEASKITEGFAESALNIMKDIFHSCSGIQKKAAMAGYGGDLLGKTLLGSELIENLPKMTSDKSKSELEQEINTTALMNALQQHSIKRAFMRTAADPTVARYPLHQVTSAFNDALAELPVHMKQLPPSALSALLKSRTIARLGRGGAASAADVDQIQSIQQAYGRVRPEDITSAVPRGE